MKYILLASASAFAFAGAAAAEVTFSGSAELGYNDNAYGDNEGFYWSADIGVSLTQELNNGLTAGASISIDIADTDNLGQNLKSADYVVWLESENAGLYFGDTDTAATKHWSGVSGMRASNFTSDPNDALFVNTTMTNSPPLPASVEVTDALALGHKIAVLRGDLSYGGIDASVSYLVPGDSNGVAGDLEQLSIGASGSFGNFNFALAYQDRVDISGIRGGDTYQLQSNDDFSANRIFGISVGTTFGGADVTLAYASNDNYDGQRGSVPAGTSFDSLGVGVSYPVGPVTLGAYYVAQSDADRGNVFGITADYASGPIAVSVAYENRDKVDDDWSIEASYDVGNGLTVYAGVVAAGDAHYVAGEFDLGNGASLGLSWADDTGHGEDDEIGSREYQEGTTAWVSFTF